MDNIIELFESCSGDAIRFYRQNSSQILIMCDNIQYIINIELQADKILFINLDNDKQDTTQLVNLLNFKFNGDTNNIFDIVQFISDICLKNIILTNFCVVCHNTLNSQSTEYICCGEQECLYKYEELTFGDVVTEKIRKDPDINLFLIKSAIEALSCQRKNDIFEPFPTYFLKRDNVNIVRGTLTKLNGTNYDHLKNFEKLDATVTGFDPDNLINFISTNTTDQQLMTIIGKDLYVLLRFILLSCTQTIKLEQSDDFMGLSSKEMKIYTMSDNKDFNKDKATTQYLFHGSNWSNWYSILRNGLKNCSKTKLMLTGAAYGAGIYLSNNVGVSYNYGNSGRKSVIGIFEVKNALKYKKNDCVFVVDDESALIQRHLLIIPKHRDNQSIISKINNTFNKQIHVEQAKTTTFYNSKSIGKIIREYKIINKIKDKNFRIEVDPEHPFQWSIFLFNFNPSFPIAQDMQKMDIKEIELELKFGQNYPFVPPFLRVVKPRFEHLTGHVTLHGAICHEILTNQGWSSTCSIETLIQLVISEIGEGSGRIDKNKYNIPYNLDEAKLSFQHVCKTHGWS